jgi:hypothetical protein
LLMFSNNGKYEKDIVRFSGTPYDVSYTGGNIVAVTILETHEVVLGILTRSITLPLESKYTMWLDVCGCITRMARRFILKSVPQHVWPISTVFVMVLVITFKNTTRYKKAL